MRRPGGRKRRTVLLALAALAGAPGCAAEAPPNVLLVVVDTLRTDALGVYGNPLPTSPVLDAFASDGVVFERAFAPAPQTAPSHASLFTSTPPAAHGVWNEVKAGDGPAVHPQLAPEAVTLAERFRDAGYATAAFADGGWVISWRGLDQGFDTFDSTYAGVDDRVDAALRWLRSRDEERPFFLFLHTYETHAPYVPPAGTEMRFAEGYDGFLLERVQTIRSVERSTDLGELQEMMLGPVREEPRPEDVAFLRALYHAEVAHVDEALGRLFRELATQGLASSTLVVVTSDHGEEFGEHGHFAHRQVYEPLLHVPMLARGPGLPEGLRRRDTARLTDLMPTLLAYAGLEPPASAVGRDLRLRAKAPPAPESPVVAESVNLPQAAVRRGALKAVLHEGDEPRALVFDLERDPAERRSLAEEPEGRAFLDEARRALAAHRAHGLRHREAHALAPEIPEGPELSDSERAALRALGYLQAPESP